MGNKTLSVVLLATAAAVSGFFVLRDTASSTQTRNPLPLDANAISADAADTGGQDDKPAVKGSMSQVELQEEYDRISDNPDYPQLETRLDAMQKRHSNRSFEPEQVVTAMGQSEAWMRIDNPPENLPLTPVEKFDGREFIRFSPLRVETLMPGDTLEIPIWQLGVRYKMRVDQTETHANGSVTWHGHLEDFSEPHRVTITVGNGLSLGGIETPRGHYVLQANGEAGWIASSETLFKRDETGTDMVIPPTGPSAEHRVD
jgi:hypothetical protein